MNANEYDRLPELLGRLDLPQELNALENVLEAMTDSLISHKVTIRCLLSTLEDKHPGIAREVPPRAQQ